MALENKIGRLLSSAERSSERRKDLFDRYMGEPRGDEQEGRSRVLTSEVFDVVESVTAELMDIVASEQTVASFTPKTAEDEYAAKAETYACNRVFWEENNGFNLLQEACRAGLIEQNGYVKLGWVQEEEISIHQYNNLTPEQVIGLEAEYAQDETIESVELFDLEGIEKTDEGYQLTEGEVSAKVRCKKTVDRYEIESLPKETVLLSPRWHKISVADVPFIAIEHAELTKADYRAMGFADESIGLLKAESDSDEEDNRHNTKNNDEAYSDERETVIAWECYVLDEDEDGIQRRVKVWVASDKKTIMEWEDGTDAEEEVDRVPIVSWSPIPVPFRHEGRGVAELGEDLEAVNTILMRQTLDNVYSTNYARPVVDMTLANANTINDLSNPDIGSAIRVNGDVSRAISWTKAPQIAGDTLPLMDRISAMKEERTGVTRLSQGMDKDTLNDTAQGQAMLLSQGQKRLKLIARNFGEFVRDIFVGMHADLRQGNRRDIAYLMGGEWQTAEPATWPERRAMRVSIGTGNGDRAEKRSTLGLVAQYQEKLMMSGSPMVDDVKVFETFDRLVQFGGFGGASTFFHDPEGQQYAQKAQAKQQQPQKPDPAIILASAEAEKARAQASKAEADAMLKLAEIEAGQRKEANRHAEKMLELKLKSEAQVLDDTKVSADIQFKGEAQDLAEQKHADEMAIKAAQQ